MATITERQILQVKEEAQGIRDTIQEAKGTYKEVVQNITNYEESLKELGVKDADKVQEVLDNIEAEIKENYNKATEIIASYKEQIDMV